jgi:hypothetical protein
MFGSIGQIGEKHLLLLLEAGHDESNRILGALNWMGSPTAIPVVLGHIKRNQNYAVVSQALGFMMRTGGPDGRDAVFAMLGFIEDEHSRAYVEKVLSAVKRTNGESLAKQVQDMGEESKIVSDEEVERHIQIMLENKGHDPNLHPATVLNSGLDSDYLLRQLMEIRRRMFWRLTPESLDDIAITNHLINTVRYRMAGE